MYDIEFYEKADGTSDVWDFLEELREKIKTNKDARIQYKQAMMYIELLQNNGTRLPDNITKHIDENIWELRPGNNRIFYFYKSRIPLFYFIISEKKLKRHQKKKSNRQKRERDDYLSRKENK